MEEKVVVAIVGRPPAEGILSTERATSSYGIPVIVVDGNDYGTGDGVLWVDGSKTARQAAARAGYRVLDDKDSLF